MNRKPLWVLVLCAAATGCDEEPAATIDTSGLADSILTFGDEDTSRDDAENDDTDDGGADRDGADEDLTGGLGAVCDDDWECDLGLYCHFDNVIVLEHGQCASPCETTQDCQAMHGAQSLCTGDRSEACVLTCEEDADCPEDTTCNLAHWCSREGVIPRGCTGAPTACADLPGTADACQAEWGCSLTPGCTGTPPTCLDFTLELDSYADCGLLRGCGFDGTLACAGEPERCEAQEDAADCGSQPGCTWTEQCGGAVLNCELRSIENCEAQPGCIVDVVLAWP